MPPFTLTMGQMSSSQTSQELDSYTFDIWNIKKRVVEQAMVIFMKIPAEWAWPWPAVLLRLVQRFLLVFALIVST